MLIVGDGAPGLIKAVEQCWPVSDRQHCAVHRARNLFAKLPEAERERVWAYWKALDDAVNERDGKERLEALVAELEPPATPPPLNASAMTSTRSSFTCDTRSDTASAGGRPICSSGRSAK